MYCIWCVLHLLGTAVATGDFHTARASTTQYVLCLPNMFCGELKMSNCSLHCLFLCTVAGPLPSPLVSSHTYHSSSPSQNSDILCPKSIRVVVFC
jgi:hypothetical protein